MASSLQNKNLTKTNEETSLHRIFHCMENQFCNRLTTASRDFLGADFYFSLTGISYEPSFLWRDNDYFVTQIQLGREVTLTLKISDSATNLMFLNALGKRQEEPGFLRLKDISELEANIITAYNEFLYKQFNELLLDPKEINSIIHTVKDQKNIYLNFYIYTKDEENEAGRIILSFPKFVFRKIDILPEPEERLGLHFFNESRVQADILIGKTFASLDEIKALEPEDIIILEQSNIHTMYLKDYEDISININPNSDLVINFDDEENGDDTVIEEKSKNKSIWDSLEVEVGASFEKVRMKLGDLREITEGLVIDAASIADNRIFLDVEGKKLAAGELVIIGDKYGVRITEIFSEAKSAEVEKLEGKTTELSPQPVKQIEQKDHDDDDEYDDDDDDDIEDMGIDEDFEESDFDMDEDE